MTTNAFDAPQDFRKLRKGNVILLSASRIMGMMTGVIRCTQDKTGIITLTYEDGSTESRQSDKTIGTDDFPSLVYVVSFVQSAREGLQDDAD